MIKVRAKISVKSTQLGGRETPFTSGYRPLFNFVPEMKISGQIELINKGSVEPGETTEVIISFLSREYLGKDFGEGKKFTFDEGIKVLGSGIVLQVIESN